MGERVKIDERWRIVIPSKFRRWLRPRDELIVEERGGEIILRRAPREKLLMKFHEKKLYVDEALREMGAEEGKHRFGGVKR